MIDHYVWYLKNKFKLGLYVYGIKLSRKSRCKNCVENRKASIFYKGWQRNLRNCYQILKTQWAGGISLSNVHLIYGNDKVLTKKLSCFVQTLNTVLEDLKPKQNETLQLTPFPLFSQLLRVKFSHL